LFLITTSRETSNRVRTFVRDIFTVYPGSTRFNRGSSSLSELAATIRTTGAAAALIVQMRSGNPSIIQVLMPDGTEAMHILIESTVLRREISVASEVRVGGILHISVPTDATASVRSFATMMSEICGSELMVSDTLDPAGPNGTNRVIVRLESLPSGRALWSHYHAKDLKEIGPRIRVTSIRSFD